MHSTFDFVSPPTLDVPLIPPPDQWPTFDAILMCAFSPESSPDPLPSAATLAAMPIPPSRSPPRNKHPDHIPRPRNAFMLFRSAFAAAQKISSTIEHDNRHITRIIAHCWNHLSDAEKQVWRDKAAVEKAQHAQRYPNYRFSPVGRANRPVKRKVRRNGIEDVKRCEKLAELVMAGKFGQELETAIKKIDNERLVAAHVVNDQPDVSTSAGPHTMASGPSDVPPFRSPLLPPATITLPAPEENAMPAPHIEPPTFCSPTLSDTSLDSLLFRRPHTRDDVSPLDHFQSDMSFAQNSHAELEQPIPDFSLLSWYQSDGFSLYH